MRTGVQICRLYAQHFEGRYSVKKVYKSKHFYRSKELKVFRAFPLSEYVTLKLQILKKKIKITYFSPL